ncbi:MAG: efflux transporter outer membrane subunit [Sporocytophaga sp.]|uniref:efflux transporter outer membrane subunit n=1 Tax=Sporocytophaga sp. TaxID=2231183 RepID=UPI001B0E072E|nr:efflux transporter outer membrane subunit [Sporocytophaga sp.]MBO9703263.1 efflux transporter outer membrane subunit [Sporocytophaga sp.]
MTKNINNLFFIVMILVLAACKLSKDFKTPEVSLQETYRNTTSTDTATIADVNWKTFFVDTTLQKLINDAIANNYDMQIALQNIEGARLQLNQTKWAYFPNAALQITGNSNRPSANSLSGISANAFLGTTHIEDFSANAALSWEADIWGKIKKQKTGALATYLQSEEARKWMQTNLVANVAEAYINLLMLDAQLAIAKRNIALNDSTLDIIRLQFEAGQVTALAVQQVEAQQLASTLLLPQIERDITLQENALSILAGELPDRIERSSDMNKIITADSLSSGVPSELLSRRPDVKNYEYELTRANAKVGISKANMYPSLSITATGGLNSFKASNWFNIPASLFGVVAGGIVQPVFQKKQLKTAYEMAKVEREKTVIQFRQSVISAVGEVSNALVRVEKSKAEQSIALNRVQTLQKAITNANILFSSGMANYLEVITAQRNALQSELELAAISREQLSAKMDLYRSLGGGWK